MASDTPASPALLAQAGETVLAGADRAVDLRWEAARRRAAVAPGPDAAARVRAVTDAFARELGVLGGATGAAAAVPGTGTLAGLAASTAEFSWFSVRLADLILTIAAIHGHGRASVEERRAWVLSVLAFGDTAASGFTRLAGEMGRGLGQRAINGIPNSTLQAVNRKLGRTIVTKYAARKGAVRLGRILPLGIGAAIGSASNVIAVRAIARQADSFFRLLPCGGEPSGGPVIDV